MNTKLMATLAFVTLATVSSAFAQIESGGLIGSTELYNCVEKQPANPKNPVQVSLAQMTGETLILTVGTSLKNPTSAVISYSNNVVQNLAVICFVECHIYDNYDDNVSFGVTVINDIIEGYYANGFDSISLSCKRGDDPTN